MQNLFYSPADKTLFYIAGNIDTCNVKDFISVLQNNYNFFYAISNVKQINTYLVEKSSRYKGMRVFYCTIDNPPLEAHQLKIEEVRKKELLAAGYTKEQIEWTMIKWLTN